MQIENNEFKPKIDMSVVDLAFESAAAVNSEASSSIFSG